MKTFIKFKSIIILTLMILTGVVLFIILYQNPTVGNNDFHLEYEIANSNINIDNLRNRKVNETKFTFTKNIYLNEVNQTKLIIHSIDFIEGVEKIIFIKMNAGTGRDKKIKEPFVEYRNQNGEYRNFLIEYDKDSIKVFNKSEFNKSLYFKGSKENCI
ncbi:hypothetical protein [Nonlabens ulvanivorans]|uniref:hypothetical protein n=1 Tax=Nonlabens ulvanivorans TaxID=906888 RepID=UPI002941BA94|nr:hypothetical protein [Nonlabens ulvanivorans]WOI21618.1 hypothetical protein R1T42_07975 [Nonlabens ulvanivorans]